MLGDKNTSPSVQTSLFRILSYHASWGERMYDGAPFISADATNYWACHQETSLLLRRYRCGLPGLLCAGGPSDGGHGSLRPRCRRLTDAGATRNRRPLLGTSEAGLLRALHLGVTPACLPPPGRRTVS